MAVLITKLTFIQPAFFELLETHLSKQNNFQAENVMVSPNGVVDPDLQEGQLEARSRIWMVVVRQGILALGQPQPPFPPLPPTAMKNATFQITPDVIKESENIQLGQDLKLSCHVDAVPQEKVTYQWFKNGKPARMSKRLLVTRNDPELPAVTSSLELIDLHFSDYGTYLCVASFPGAPVPDLSVEVNISSETGEQPELGGNREDGRGWRAPRRGGGQQLEKGRPQ